MAHCNHGNTLTQTNTATGTVTHFTWDYENRLTEVKVVSNWGFYLYAGFNIEENFLLWSKA